MIEPTQVNVHLPTWDKKTWVIITKVFISVFKKWRQHSVSLNFGEITTIFFRILFDGRWKKDDSDDEFRKIEIDFFSVHQV